MKELRGKEVAEHIRQEVLAGAERFEKAMGRKPRLVILRCGENPADLAYERNALKKAEQFGLEAVAEQFPEDVADSLFQHRFFELNEDRRTDGILLLRPLPKQLNEGFLISSMDAEKDLDGISPVNAAGVYLGTESFAPCTAEAVMELLHFYGIEAAGRHVVIIGRSAVVGKPLSMLLLEENATVTICHSHTEELQKVCRKADILISAAGKPRFVTEEFIRRGTVVIDVGMNAGPDGRFCGDVDFERCRKKASAMTPVPGGVGAITTAVLMKHLLQAAEGNLL